MAKAQIAEPVQSMTRAEYRLWSQQQLVGRCERIDGVVVAMAPERVEHNDRKMRAWLALRRAVRDANAPCHVNGNSMTVEIGDSDYEPDAILYCGERLPPGNTTVPNPLIIVEVLSPSTSATDRAWKLREYIPPLVRPPLPHHLGRQGTDCPSSRNDAGAIETTVWTSGEIALEPPGIAITVEEIYAD